jgi:hypothetical protein
MRRLLPYVIAAIVAGGAWTLQGLDAKEGPVTEIQVGDTPGGFALNDQEGKAVRLGHGKDHGWFVLAFYPKASTGG